uniref:Magnesium-protoporphyrin IX methyltransferase C-terminal domain-containing protein n=1 Tax=Lotharella oceanica TaxID=641309 RepID=A0A7S2X8I5_9EUKA
MATRPVMRYRRANKMVVHSAKKPPCRTERSNAALLAATAATAPLLAQSAHAAAEKIATVAGDMDMPSTLISQGIPTVIAGALAVNFLADPERRRQEMTEAAGGDEMASVKNYFNGEGFQRWRKIYGETDEVNKVQKDIRDGHAVTVSKVINWLGEGVKGKAVCDAGCGTGSLTIPLALKGAKVSASDIAVEMTKEAERRFEERKGNSASAVAPVFDARGLEEIEGKYDVVTCLDVMIHYPQDKANGMVKHLASLANEKLIISFAPKTLYYSTLKRIGELFPGPSKATRAYLHAEEDVERALNEVGWKVVKREMTATNFYFSRLLEAVPM